MSPMSTVDREVVLSLLRSLSNPFLAIEEDQHPWSINRFPVFERPFLRTWDLMSGSQPDQGNRMQSRAPRQRLDTIDTRVQSLTTHADHGDWTPTPFISFTVSKIALQSLANYREGRRGTQTITVVNPNARIAKGLPVLDMMNEMDYYDVPNPYGRISYFEDHYLCLWEITDDEIVGHWDWGDLSKNDYWFEEIIIPAFREHDERASIAPLRGGTFDLSDLLNELPGVDISPDPEISSGHSSFEDGLSTSFDDELDWSDTDDEAEEANATDDMFKILEEDW
ncbi:uncharacterized protein TRUGW13939_09703 [Talaromyces rugulosus]|uniref:DUF7587 domain-containing protein n=1 Tax=Talaromyces rugulosus TaxID=121627 RepID=A0A7H8R828_TALRU|nr:uncharacterized protein TRUGW13939_09703 [Talaromyces rugulosus]QKX62542.1 hypothetical protein TRUGW13939_09703 [Talaromyces rugulosus]